MSGDNRTLNIALENGNVVGPYLNNYSNGFGNSVGSGAIYWNGSQLSTTQSVEYADQLSIYGESGTWAQGGIVLWLGYYNWENQFKIQKHADAYQTTNPYLWSALTDRKKQTLLELMDAI